MTTTAIQAQDHASGRQSFADSSTLSEFLLGSGNAWDKSYDDFQQWKKDNHLPIKIGAHNWFHYDRNDRILGDGYGGDTLDGTYFWYLQLDPSMQLDRGPFSEIGLHVEGRIRDGTDKFRPFVSGKYWSYEAYVYGKTDYGTFKAGQIVTKFGLPWDGTWWEGAPYFDGYSFDPDYGVSWENQWEVSNKLSMDASAQFFFHSDDVNGSIAGADAESAPGTHEKNTIVLRAAPTYKFDNGIAVTWGVSALYGQLDGSTPGVDDDRYAFGTDITATYGNFKVFTDYIDSYGAVNPVRYVSGGPSDRINSARVGASYQWGPVNLHASYSRGWDHNPDGNQEILNLGFTTQLTKNVTLYTEYVDWNVENSAGQRTKFEDGFQVVFVWNL